MIIACPARTQRQAIANARASSDVSATLDWAALTLSGPDAERFLQGQLTCDMTLVNHEQASLGCLLNLKGRIEASLLVMRNDVGYALLMPEKQRSAVHARLAKYAAFSQVSINLSDLMVSGKLGLNALPNELSQTPFAVLTSADAVTIRLPGQHRALTLARLATADPEPIALAAWQAEAIACGEVVIDVEQIDQWQPQELDYHALGGVSYQKGCYMGQEIVARLYFRGQLKTGLCWLRAAWTCDSDASLDWPIVSGDKTVGRVISAAWPNDHELWLLASVRLNCDELCWQLPNAQTVALTRHDFIC